MLPLILKTSMKLPIVKSVVRSAGMFIAKKVIRHLADNKVNDVVIEKLDEFEKVFNEKIKLFNKNTIRNISIVLLMLLLSWISTIIKYRSISVFLIAFIYDYTIIMSLKSLIKTILFLKNDTNVKLIYRNWKKADISYTISPISFIPASLRKKSKRDIIKNMFSRRRILLTITNVYLEKYEKLVPSYGKIAHLAASKIGLIKDKQEIFEEILNRVKNLFKRYLRSRIKRFIIFSTTAFFIIFITKAFIINYFTGMSLFDYLIYPFVFLIDFFKMWVP